MDPTTSPATLKADVPTDRRVSVIVATFNRAHYLRECLDSLLEQTVPAHEIVVVDDGSEDDTTAVVAAYGSPVRYVHKENGGKPSAINLALALIEGDLVWLFDDDDVALPDAIEKRLQALERRPDAGFVYSPHYLGTDGADGRIVLGRRHDTPFYDDDCFLHELLKGCFFHLNSALVRRGLYQAVGPFDGALLSSEDYDMQIRLAVKARAAFCPAPTFVFRQHQGVRGAKSIRYAHTKRSEIFRNYDRMMGLKLRDALPLGDYLVPRCDFEGCPERTREALLSRMAIMASKGCLDAMMADLSQALRTLAARERFNGAEQRAITEAICTGYAYRAARQDWPRFISLLDGLLQYPAGPQAVLALARGLMRIAYAYPGSLKERSRRLLAGVSLVRIGFFSRIAK